MIKFFGTIVIMYAIHLILFRVMKWDHVTLYIFVTKYTFKCQCDKWQITGCQWVSSPPPNSFCTHTHTHTYAHTCTHTHTHTSVQIFLGFERTLVATLIKSYLIPHENGQLGFIVQMAALLRLSIPIPNHTFQCQCEKWQITGYQWFPSPLNSSSVHTHTHTHTCVCTHTHQCPDKPGLWKDTCCSLNKIKSNTTWRGVTRVYSSNCWSAEITYSNPKGYWFGFIQKVQISLCMMAEVGSIQARILPGTPS